MTEPVDDDPRSQFREQVRALRVAAGSPSDAYIARRASLGWPTSRYSVQAMFDASRRIPHWPVTAAIITALGGQPLKYAAAWHKARNHTRRRGVPPDDPRGRFAFALAGIRAAAGMPNHQQIADRATALNRVPIGRRTATQALTPSGRVPRWEVVETIVLALHGDPDDVYELWRAAYAAAAWSRVAVDA